MNLRRSIWVLSLCLLLPILIAGYLLLTADRGETLFHGKPEKLWIEELEYRNSDQVDLWRGLGTDGVTVLMRGWERSQRPWSRSYRKTYRAISRNTPGWFVKILPDPKQDSTRSTRVRIISLLSYLSKDAMEALPVVIDALRDEDGSVRSLAINYFTAGEDDHVLLNQLTTAQRKQILDLILPLASDFKNSVSRNNVMVALRYFPEEKGRVIPILEEGLKESDQRVRIVALISFVKLDPQQAILKGAIPVAIDLLRQPDPQIASRVAEIMGELQPASLLVVPALLQAAQSQSALLANDAIRSLGKFSGQAADIIPALKKLQQAKDKTANTKLIQETIQKLEADQLTQ